MAEDCLNYLSNSDKVRMMPGTEDKFIKNICNDLVDEKVPLSEQLRDLMSKSILEALKKPTNINEIGNTVVRNVFNSTLNVVNGPLLLNSLIKNGKGDSDDVRLKIVKIFKNIFTRGMTLKQFLLAFKSTISNESGIFKLDEKEMKGGNYTMKKKRKKKRKNKTVRNKIKGGAPPDGGGGKSSDKDGVATIEMNIQEIDAEIQRLQKLPSGQEQLQKIENLKANKIQLENKKLEQEKGSRSNLQYIGDAFNDYNISISEKGREIRDIVDTSNNDEDVHKAIEESGGSEEAKKKLYNLYENKKKFRETDQKYSQLKEQRDKIGEDKYDYIRKGVGLTTNKKRRDENFKELLNTDIVRQQSIAANRSNIDYATDSVSDWLNSGEQFTGTLEEKMKKIDNSNLSARKKQEVLEELRSSELKNENTAKLQDIATKEEKLNTGFLGKLTSSDKKKQNLQKEREETLKAIENDNNISAQDKKKLKEGEEKRLRDKTRTNAKEELKDIEAKESSIQASMLGQLGEKLGYSNKDKKEELQTRKEEAQQKLQIADIEDRTDISESKKKELIQDEKNKSEEKKRQKKQKDTEESLQKIAERENQLNENRRKGMLEKVLGNAATEKELKDLQNQREKIDEQRKKADVANRSEFQKAMDSFSDSRVSNDASKFVDSFSNTADVSAEVFKQNLDRSGYSEAKKQELTQKHQQALDLDKAKNPEKRSVSDAMKGLGANIGEAATGAQNLLAKAFGATTPTASTPEKEAEEQKKREAAGITDGPGETKMDLNQMIQELYNEYNTEILDLFTKRMPFLEMLLFEKILNATYVHSKANSDVILGSIKDALKGALRKNNVIKKSDNFIFIHALNGSYHYIRKSLKYVYDKQIEENQKEIMSQNENKLGTIENIPFDPTNENFIDEFIIYFLSLSDVKIFDKIKKPKKKKEKKKEKEYDEETPLELM